MKKTIYLIVALTTLIVSGCSSDYFETTNNPLSYGESYIDITISTDKALYNPGETVKFIAKGIPDGAKVRYTYLGNVISETNLSTEHGHGQLPMTITEAIWWKFIPLKMV